MGHFELILASASPRRLELLRSVGIEPKVIPSVLDEIAQPGEDPADMTVRLAGEKGQAVRARLLSGAGATSPARLPIILAADTTVILDGAALGKPESDLEAAQMLHALSGREHQVCTAIYLARVDREIESFDVATTRVRFAVLSPAWIAKYVASGEPRGKAGAYAIQGRAALVVESIRGSWSNVVGLPLERLPAALAAIGVDSVDRLS